MDGHFGLVVLGGREHLALVAGDGRVGLDEFGHHAAEGFDTERQRRHVEQDDLAHALFLIEDSSLDGGTYGHYFIGVDTFRRSLAEEVLYELLHGGDTGGAAHKDDFVDFRSAEAGTLQGCLTRSLAGFDQRVCQCFKLSTCERLDQVFGHATHGHDVRQVDFGRGRAGEFNLGLFGSFLQALHGHRVGREVGALVVLEFLYEPVDDDVVEVIAAQVGIAVGGEHFEYAATKFEDGDIEGTAAQVEHGNLHILVSLVDTVGQCGCRRLVDDALYIESGDLTGFLGSLTLRVAEVGRHGDDSFGHLLSKVVFGGLLHLLERHGRDFLRRILASVDFDARCVVVAAYHGVGHTCDFLLHLVVGLTHEALDGVDGALGVGDGLTLGGVAHLALAAFDESHDARCGALTFAVCDNYGFVSFEYGNAGVGSS